MGWEHLEFTPSRVWRAEPDDILTAELEMRITGVGVEALPIYLDLVTALSIIDGGALCFTEVPSEDDPSPTRHARFTNGYDGHFPERVNGTSVTRSQGTSIPSSQEPLLTVPKMPLLKPLKVHRLKVSKTPFFKLISPEL